mgnify:CR=1 FL=1
MEARVLLQRAREKYPFIGFEVEAVEKYLELCEQQCFEPHPEDFYLWVTANSLYTEIEL